MVPPPPTPASPMTQRKLSVNAPFRSSPGQSPNPPPGGFLPKRPIEKMEDNKITRFGEPRMKSPAPPSTPPRQFSPPLNQQQNTMASFSLYCPIIRNPSVVVIRTNHDSCKCKFQIGYCIFLVKCLPVFGDFLRNL